MCLTKIISRIEVKEEIGYKIMKKRPDKGLYCHQFYHAVRNKPWIKIGQRIKCKHTNIDTGLDEQDYNAGFHYYPDLEEVKTAIADEASIFASVIVKCKLERIRIQGLQRYSGSLLKVNVADYMTILEEVPLTNTSDMKS